MLLDVNKAASLVFIGVCGLQWMLLDYLVVERRRIELPTSALRTRRSPS